VIGSRLEVPWQETPLQERCDEPRVAAALAKVLRSEHAHFSLLWERASASSLPNR
jgi:hypothetical protein